MKLRIYQVDAFAERVFEGNPAAVVPLESWPADRLLQSIASENNLSETAYFVPLDHGYELRWFTPEAEVDLCGHATLASAHVLFFHLGHQGSEIAFETRSGRLTVRRAPGGLTMDFPAIESEETVVPEDLVAGLGAEPVTVLAAPDYIAVYQSEAQIRALAPDFARLKKLDRRGVLATAPGDHHDFVSRCFFPKLGVDEDPVTGSAHCKLAPYWASRLGRTQLVGRQISPRGGTVKCRVEGERVQLTGRSVDYLIGDIDLT